MNIEKIKNNKINFKSKVFPTFDNFSMYFQKPQKNDTFVSNTIQQDKPKNEKGFVNWHSVSLVILSIAGITLAHKGITKLMQKPSRADIELTKFLDNKANELSKITETLKSNVKNLYEKQLGEFKKLFAVPDSKLPQNIQNTVAEINNAKSVQELFTLEDRAVTGIYEWFRNTSRQQKPASEFIEPFNKFKTNLLDRVKKLQDETLKELEKPLDIPENLKKTKHSKQIFDAFNNVVKEEKDKTDLLYKYIGNLANEDTKDLFLKYNEDFDKLLTTKNRSMVELLKMVKTMKEKMLWGKETPAFDCAKVSLPNSITKNKFFQFVNSNKKDSQKWRDFITNSLGKDLSYKDINILEQRLLLRNGIFVDEKTIDKFEKDKLTLFEFFKEIINKKAPSNFDEHNMDKLQKLEILDMANSIKDKYGDSSLLNMVKEFTGSYNMNMDSLIFKIDSIFLRNSGKIQMKNEFYLPRTFNWDDMNYKIRGWEE